MTRPPAAVVFGRPRLTSRVMVRRVGRVAGGTTLVLGLILTTGLLVSAALGTSGEHLDSLVVVGSTVDALLMLFGFAMWSISSPREVSSR